MSPFSFQVRNTKYLTTPVSLRSEKHVMMKVRQAYYIVQVMMQTIPLLICTGFLVYRKVASRSTCYYSENQVFGGATNQDMSLNKLGPKLGPIFKSQHFFS